MPSLVVSFVLGVAICFVPLFNLLGYESSAACGFVLGLVVLFSTVHAVRSGAVAAPLAADRTTSPGLDFSRLLIRNELLQLVPLALLGLNMVRVQNCDPFGGLLFWLAIVPGAIVVAQTIAWSMLALVGPRWLAAVLASSVVAIDLLDFGLGLALRPPIIGHSLLFGYFAGSLYDEALTLPSSLLWYRASNFVLAITLLAVIETRFRRRASNLVRWVLGISIVSFTLLALTAQDHGIGLDARRIQDELGGRVESEHFVIYFSHQELDDPEDVRRLVEDHEYRYWELSRYFGVDIDGWRGRKLESYVYPNAKRQHDLMGAQDTFVARPWTHAMHVRWDDYGDSGIAHEMAHLFTAAFGYGPFQVATRGGIPADIGLVEGIAVAADWPPTEMDPDVASAAMRKLGIAPKLERLFRPFGFWTQPNAKAYTLMASFVHWLIETRGIESFEKVYARGDFEGVYGRPVKALVADWNAWVDAIPVDDATLERARVRYDKKSIFEKVCARTIAELDRKAGSAKGSGDLDKALELRQRILSFQPNKTAHKVEMARVLRDLERPEEALAVVEDVLASGKVRRAEESDVRELEADLLYDLGRTDDAKREYDTCDERPLSEGDQRRIDLKQRALFTDDETIRGLAERYLFDAKNRTAMLYYALRWTEEEPGDPIARYLVGFQLWQNHEEDQAVPWLVGPPGTLPTRALDDQRMLVLGFSLFRIGALDDANEVFGALLDDTHGSRARSTALEWRDRVVWKRDHASATHAP
jgi:tetratricopeptide (TPR) repeat protein